MDLFDSLPIAPDNAEVVVRDSVLVQFEVTRAGILTWLRGRMVVLYKQRVYAQGHGLAHVTADDARVLIDTDPRIPGADKLNRNFLGKLFLAPGWKWTGEFVKSRTPGSHANLLKCWRWEGV